MDGRTALSRPGHQSLELVPGGQRAAEPALRQLEEQSRDRLAREPYLTQYFAGPYYVPPPGVSVALSLHTLQAKILG